MAAKPPADDVVRQLLDSILLTAERARTLAAELVAHADALDQKPAEEGSR